METIREIDDCHRLLNDDRCFTWSNFNVEHTMYGNVNALTTLNNEFIG